MEMKGNGWMNVIVVMGLLMGESSFGRSTCPTKIQPCTCIAKARGLVINCVNSDTENLMPAVTALKESHAVISYLTFRTNNLPRLPDHIFMGMDIRHLIITGTNLRVIESGSLAALGNTLNVLEITSNLISHLPTHDLSKLVFTRILNLNHNNISAIPEGAFDGMVKLQRLTLFGNHITRIEANAFRGVEKELYVLNLGGNELDSVPTEAISKLSNLNQLELQGNRIESVTESDFAGLDSLDTLRLGQNQIKELGSNVFSVLPRLSVLDLASNRISRLDDKAFSGLEERLEYLKLGNNSIRTIPSVQTHCVGCIGSGNWMSTQTISQNSRKTHLIHTEVPSGFYFYKTMVLSDLFSLEILSLSNNGLRHVPHDVFAPVMETIQVIDVQANLLKCDCDIIWYQEWIIKASKTNKDQVGRLLLSTKCWFENYGHEYLVNEAPLEHLCCPVKTLTRTVSQCMSEPFSPLQAAIGVLFFVNLISDIGTILQHIV